MPIPGVGLEVKIKNTMKMDVMLCSFDKKSIS